MDGIEVVVVDPRGPEARAALRRYLGEITHRGAHPTAEDEVDDVDEYVAPDGTFLRLDDGGATVGCSAVRTIGPSLGEIKRMWVDPDRRREGLGAAMLAALEDASRTLGHTRVRLDTNGALTPAILMYESRGYRPIERYNDNPHATHFYEKALASD
jgi:GNAT superfamily N-acetyltransferase